MTDMKKWEKKVLATPGAAERIADIEEELRLAAGLTALREQAGLSQRELAQKIGVSQPRIAAIERSHNVTIDVLEQYVGALGCKLQLSVVKGRKTIPLIPAAHARARRQACIAPPNPSPFGTHFMRRLFSGRLARAVDLPCYLWEHTFEA
jgi:transcriptional regulator with XRE-family HTH domain